MDRHEFAELMYAVLSDQKRFDAFVESLDNDDMLGLAVALVEATMPPETSSRKRHARATEILYFLLGLE